MREAYSFFFRDQWGFIAFKFENWDFMLVSNLNLKGTGCMWNEFNGSPDEWDAIVMSFDNHHPTHCYNWGNIQSSGRKVYRLVYSPGSNHPPTSAIQLMHRKLAPGLHYLRSDGGLSGDYSSLDKLKLLITTKVGHSNWCLRMFIRGTRGPKLLASLLGAEFHPSLSRIHTGLSAALELRSPYLSNYSGNWKHNLSRARKRNLNSAIVHKISPSELAKIYRELELAKNIGEQFSPAEIQLITESLGTNLIASEVRSASGELISVRAAIIAGSKAFDLIAATNNQGRSNYASNLALHNLLEACANQGVQWYDFAGIDPQNGKGVMNFKLGAGATPFEYMGEWDYSPKNWVRNLANALMFLKLRSKRQANPSSTTKLSPKNVEPDPDLIDKGH
jgi:hypothetical protein